ncbi:phosphotransferase [Sphingorhabdus arenilitoris]|uniref:Phosphotransferase n=1 Tax=Sphingorhabdus arenilitoris TaxID=1490041 RepID=A0ABV8RI67_9SPHN
MIPLHPDQMDAAWIADKLNAPADSLENFHYAAIGTGQMCDSFRLTLNWDEAVPEVGLPSTIIAKCPAMDDASRHIAKLVRNYELEISWYRDLARQTPVQCPGCYHAELDDNGVDFALLLQDCSPAQQGDQLGGADHAQLSAAITQLANLHAAHWNSPSLSAYHWLQYGTANKELVRTMLPALYTGFRDRYVGRLDERILDIGQQLSAHIGIYLDKEPSAQSVVHGDFRLDNLLFANNGNVTVVDWQTVSAGCPFTDLAYFIGTSIADPEIRRAEEAALFDHYLAQLLERGIAADRERGWQDYRLYAFSGLIMAIFASMNVERTDRGDEMFAVMAERPARQAIDLESISLLYGAKAPPL